MSQPDFETDSLVQEFQAEALEHLNKVEQELVVLEKQADDPDPEMIADVFRSIHSIKGAAGFMGFTQVGEICHLVETLLQMMRQGTIRPDQEKVDVLLPAIDIVKTLIARPEDDTRTETRKTADALSSLIALSGTDEIREKMETDITLPGPSGEDSGFCITEFELDAVPADCRNFYGLEYNLHEFQEKEGMPLLVLVRDLLAEGVIIKTRVDTGAVDFDQDLSEVPLLCHVLYATSLEIEGVETISRLGRENIRRIQPAAESADDGEAEANDAKEEAAALPVSHDASTNASKGAEPGPEPETDPETENIPGIQLFKEEREGPDTVRLRVDILDKLMKMAGELVLVRNQLLVMTQADAAYRGISQRLNLVTSEMQETIMQTRLQPMENLFAKLPRVVRDLASRLDKQIEIQTRGNYVELDKTIMESLTDPMLHLIRNCCDHGLESPDGRRKAGKPDAGRISVNAWHEAGQINIEVADDGRGLDPGAIKTKIIENGLKTPEEVAEMSERELFSLILMSGFSTARQVSDISGRGVGMDVVRAAVERMGGAIDLSSSPGRGTRIHLRLPLTLAIIPCLLVKVGESRFAIPQSNLEELVCLRDEEICTRIESAGDQEVFRLRDRLLPLVRLEEVLNRPEPFTHDTRVEISNLYGRAARRILSGDREQTLFALNFAVVKIGQKRYGLVVDEVVGVEEIVVSPIHSSLENLGIYSGATIMGDGAIGLILDIEGIAAHADVQFNIREAGQRWQDVSREDIQTVLLFKSGPQEQFALPLPMIRRVEQVKTSRIEKIGDKDYITVAGTPHRVLRLDEHLNVSPCTEHETMFLLLPKFIRRPFGVLVSEITDTVKTSLELNVESHMEAGLMGTGVIRNHIVLFLDLFRLIELSEPDWFYERKKNAPPPAGQRHVLLLEDTPFFRNLVRGYLEDDGYQVTAVENGKEGVAALSKDPFDAIVSDLDMPLMDGWAFMEYVRRESPAPDIPAVALTALDSETDRERTLSAGFNGFLVKLNREDLLTRLSKALTGKEDAREDSL